MHVLQCLLSVDSMDEAFGTIVPGTWMHRNGQNARVRRHNSQIDTITFHSQPSLSESCVLLVRVATYTNPTICVQSCKTNSWKVEVYSIGYGHQHI